VGEKMNQKSSPIHQRSPPFSFGLPFWGGISGPDNFPNACSYVTFRSEFEKTDYMARSGRYTPRFSSGGNTERPKSCEAVSEFLNKLSQLTEDLMFIFECRFESDNVDNDTKSFNMTVVRAPPGF
jgi:hypothetical protein